MYTLWCHDFFYPAWFLVLLTHEPFWDCSVTELVFHWYPLLQILCLQFSILAKSFTSLHFCLSKIYYHHWASPLSPPPSSPLIFSLFFWIYTFWKNHLLFYCGFGGKRRKHIFWFSMFSQKSRTSFVYHHSYQPIYLLNLSYKHLNCSSEIPCSNMDSKLGTEWLAYVFFWVAINYQRPDESLI